MDYCAILYVGVIANGYAVYIATNNCIKPNGTTIAHFHFANHYCSIGHKAIFTKLGLKTSYFPDDIHVVFISVFNF
jgi:hypothetical protein